MPPRRTMEAIVSTLTGTTAVEIAALATNDCHNALDLLGLTMDDLLAILPTASITKQRKLFQTGLFVLRGGNLVANTTTMLEINQFVGTVVIPNNNQAPTQGIDAAAIAAAVATAIAGS